VALVAGGALRPGSASRNPAAPILFGNGEQCVERTRIDRPARADPGRLGSLLPPFAEDERADDDATDATKDNRADGEQEPLLGFWRRAFPIALQSRDTGCDSPAYADYGEGKVSDQPSG